MIQYEKMLQIGHDNIHWLLSRTTNSEELEKNRRSFQRGELIGGFCRNYVVIP
ncbi:hypothetical protein [Nostoc sp. WHI]|uniref:hypothetical protein n=1 Tax=Nostoc sp. WHI TaxID=2650611 RepID=UPI0018C451DF|nr:hypothetical protein [Nostoc sp. WHI]